MCTVNSPIRLTLVLFSLAPVAQAGGATEFCLDGEFDLGARYQGIRPEAGEMYPTSWCVTTEDASSRVFFRGAGQSNPDMYGEWSVAYLPPDVVRIVNRDAPPDIEFQGTDNAVEALRVRRLDPRRLVEEYRENPRAFAGLDIELRDGQLLSVTTTATLPLRGAVDAVWQWDWTEPSRPLAELVVDGEALFRATGSWRELSETEAGALWEVTPGADKVEVPGDRWPARINMQLINLTDDVYLVRGVRTGFQHMVVETEQGLVVADAPAGWVEFHHIPPSDMVPGLDVSGLSEQFIDFLQQEFPGRPIHAVALTHFHDDHAGGARAFAAAGAQIYTTAESVEFFAAALNRESMPDDRLSTASRPAAVWPVQKSFTIGREPNRVKVLSMGANPHAYAMLGIWALDRDYFFVSDIHVPRSDADAPRAGREATECWFAAWAVQNLPPEVSIVNSHSDQISPVQRLAMYLESPQCRTVGEQIIKQN